MPPCWRVSPKGGSDRSQRHFPRRRQHLRARNFDMRECTKVMCRNTGVLLVTYRLYIRVPRRVAIEPGRLGSHALARGWYVYTGSARRNMASRLRRHLSGAETRRWHIDWLLGSGPGQVMHVVLDSETECVVNARLDGQVAIPRFGATDCRNRCGSHLLWLGTRRPRAVPRDPSRRRAHAAVAALETPGSAA